MKLKNIIPQRFRTHIVHEFGRARLIRLPNGQHELVGGTDADRTAAFEWISLFAHEIVFTHFHREAASRRRLDGVEKLNLLGCPRVAAHG